MPPRLLREPMRVFRIGDPNGRFPIWSGEGAALVEGRWHDKGQDVIYTSQYYGTAMLEKLASYNGMLPPNQHFIEAIIPAGASYEEVTKDTLPGWDLPASHAARAHGSSWLRARRSVIMIVPSVVSREELNVLINPQHPEAPAIGVGREKPVRWDSRLFQR